MVIILDNVINNIDSVKVDILDILKDQNINENWYSDIEAMYKD